MFIEDSFEAGIEFKTDFISNIYSRLFLPKNDVLSQGQNFAELMMIQQGIVNCYLEYEDEEINHDF
jgi:hypothetical protein